MRALRHVVVGNPNLDLFALFRYGARFRAQVVDDKEPLEGEAVA